MSEWLLYRLKKLTEMRPYVEGESLVGVTVTQANRDNGNPTKGDMIARDPLTPEFQSIVTQAQLEHDYEPAMQAAPPTPPVLRKAPAHVGPDAKVDPKFKVETPFAVEKKGERKEKDDDDDDEPKKKDDPKKR
jgi:Syntaxin-5 N-terminal, Sly1p-binding domain